MPEPPRRARFQIHLSTAIVMMFVAGGLIWANVNGRRVECWGIAWTGPASAVPIDGEGMTDFDFIAAKHRYAFWAGNRLNEHGWPFDSVLSGTSMYIDRSGEFLRIPEPVYAVWRTTPLIYNALIALAILFAVWFLCEWLIRRRSSRKKA